MCICLFTKLASKIFDLFSFIIIFSFYYNISFGKIIKKMSFAIFDVTLYYLLEKRTQVRQLLKQITTIKKKKRVNKFKRPLYNLILRDERTLTYVETIYITNFRNCTILNLNSKNNL